MRLGRHLHVTDATPRRPRQYGTVKIQDNQQTNIKAKTQLTTRLKMTVGS
jgi:hypothetical protein